MMSFHDVSFGLRDMDSNQCFSSEFMIFLCTKYKAVVMSVNACEQLAKNPYPAKSLSTPNRSCHVVKSESYGRKNGTEVMSPVQL